MRYTHIDTGIIFDGTPFLVGMKIAANDQSAYKGLYGTITEIRTGEDQETENEVPDIECCFEPPVLKEEIAELEARFSTLHQQPKTMEEISLDVVIMAPEMLKPLDECMPQDKSVPIYIVMNEWEDGDGSGHSESYFTDYNAAKHQFDNDLQEDHTNGIYAYWHCEPDFSEESEADFYCCRMENSHTYHHFALRIEKQLLPISSDFAAEVANLHTHHTRIMDLFSLLPKDTVLPVSSGALKNLERELARVFPTDTACSDDYWEALQSLAEEFQSKLDMGA